LFDSVVFLDRDGVLIKTDVKKNKPVGIKHIDEVVYLDGVEKSIELFYLNSILPIIITNQPNVARQETTVYEVNEIHKKIKEDLKIENIYCCFHDDVDCCSCRKPKNGLIKKGLAQLDFVPKTFYLVGDRWKDIRAGQESGCQCFFIDYSYDEKQPKEPFTRVQSLSEAADIIIGINHNKSKR
jgi:D-glycero-D-manno-heptose 1,7-bisphosphate phosphatase